MADAKNFAKREFVYTGIRLSTDHKRFVTLQLIEADGTLGREMNFDYKKARTRLTGSVYTCEFSEDGSTVRGLDEAGWVRRWENEADRMKWQALERDAEMQNKILENEKKAGTNDDIERVMIPLRVAYSKMQKRFDYSGMAAMERYVLQVLKQPLRTKEQ